MTTLTTVSINDEVPAAHVFEPRSRQADGTVSFINDTVDGRPDLAEKLRLKIKITEDVNGLSTVEHLLQVPVIRSVDGVNQPVAYMQAKHTFTLPNITTDAERLTLRTLASNLAAETNVKAYVEGMEGFV